MFLILLLTTARGLLGPSGGFQDDGHVDQTGWGDDDGWGDDSDCDGLNCAACTSYHNDCVFYQNRCIMWNDVPEFASDSDIISNCDNAKGSSYQVPDRAFDQSRPGNTGFAKWTGSCKNLNCLDCTEYHTTCVFYKNKCMDWKDPPKNAEMDDYTMHTRCPDYVLRYDEESVAGAATYLNKDAWWHHSERFTNPDGQKCKFDLKQKAYKGNQWSIKCGWNGADKKYQKKYTNLTPKDCIMKCRAHQWCNYAYNPSMGWGQSKTDCFLFGTCNDQTTNSPDGRLYEKKCPNTPKLPRTMHVGPCDGKNGCEKYANQWIKDGLCDFGICANCESYWQGDVFDGGDCKGQDMKMMTYANESETNQPSALVLGFALLGFGFTFYGAARYYWKGE